MSTLSDIKFLTTVVALLLFGAIMVLDASANFALGVFGRYHYFVLQVIWIIIGSILAFIFYKIDYHKLQKYSLPAIIIIIFLLVLVLIKGEEINGARRWISLGLFNFQPSEIAKIAIIIYLSSWLSKPLAIGKGIKNTLKYRFKIQVFPFLTVIGIVSGLVIFGKDLGTGAIILTSSILIFFLAGSDFIQTLETIILLAGSLIAVTIAIVVQPYRIGRLLSFTNYSNNIQGQGYQIHQILIALAQGGLFGQGFTQSLQKTQYLVQATAITDSIFAVIAETWGYVGCSLFFIVFGYIIFRGFKIAFKAPDKYGQLLAAGITAWLFIQFFFNIGANIVLVPLTGVPLPFISYGGSSTITLLIAIGIILNISRQEK